MFAFLKSNNSAMASLKREMISNKNRLTHVLRNKLSRTRFFAFSSSFSTTTAVSYRKPATTANTPASFIKFSTTPKSSTSYILPKIARAAKPISCATIEPLNSLPAFFRKSDLIKFKATKERIFLRERQYVDDSFLLLNVHSYGYISAPPPVSKKNNT